MSTSLEEEILNTVGYFDFFNYQPTINDLYIFLKKKASRYQLTRVVNLLVKKNTLGEYGKKTLKYTQGRYGIKQNQKTKAKYQKLLLRQAESKKKLEKIQLFINVLSKFKEIKLIGLSGSMAMNNADKNDDIDLFIINKNRRLWTGRLLALILAQILGLRRRRKTKDFTDKICLNLFFDEGNLTISKFKRNEYVAHEVLQMRPLVNKDRVYEKFLEANKWVYTIYPNSKITNSKSQITSKLQITINKRFKNWNLNIVWSLVLGIWNFIGDLAEWLLKQAQLALINRHRTTEIITDTQLWFFPDDFEKKIIRAT